jgi:4-hydroxy-tetrahydrodipicolinate synthase
MLELGRLITAMVTPFKEDGSVDYDQAQKLATALMDSGSDGVVVAGTTGESPTVTWEEEQHLFRAVKEAIGSRGSVIAGTGSNSTDEAAYASKKAEKTGIDACLLVVPYYNKPSQEGLYQHFKEVAAATSLPCILYNVPSRTVVSLSTDTTLRLAKINNIIGIKEASGKFGEVATIIKGAHEGFYVWSGNDSDTFSIMSFGGYGVISVASHLVGRQIKNMVSSLINGEVQAAAKIHIDLLPLFDVLFLESNPAPLKYALNTLGFNVGKPRLPLVEPQIKTRAAIETALKNFQIDLLL